MKIIIIIILLFSNLVSEDLSKSPIIQSRIRLFEAWLETLIDDYSLMGVSVGVIHDQNIVYSKGFGHADFENKILADDSINYKIASITKLFTSIALMQLVENQKIKLSDPIIDYIPELKNIQANDYNYSSITIKSILTHTAGLPAMPKIILNHNNKIELSASNNTFLNELKQQNIIFKPNRIHKYSNLGINLAGVIIERISGLSYNNYINNHILNR